MNTEYVYWKVELTTDYLVWDVGDLNIKYQMSGVVSSIMDENIRSWWLAWVVMESSNVVLHS